MHSLPASTATSLAVDELTGTIVSDRGDHLLVRTPVNPLYHWGNYVQVTTGDVDAADHWLEIFAAEFPGAGHRAIGLPRRPDPAVWGRHHLDLEVEQSLVAASAPPATPTPTGYAVRQLASDRDWALRLAQELDENARTGEHPPGEYRAFMERQIASRRELVGRGVAAWFGAFTPEGELAGSLGIVVLGERARYQSVLTHADHRRRGIARHLLTHAATWARSCGVRQLVIVADSGSPAARLYERAGFNPGADAYAAYRARS